MSVRRLVLATGKIEVVAGVKGDVRDQLGSDQKNTPIKSEDLASILKRLRQNSEELEQRGRFAVRLPGRYPSFDGKYTILSSTYFSRLQLLDNQTGTTKVIKESGAYNPAWLKDSKKIVWGSGYPPEQQLVIYDVETGSSQEINIKNEGDDTSCNEPAVGRNSEYIAYVCGTPYSPIDDNWIYILDLKTGASVKLVPGNSPDLY